LSLVCSPFLDQHGNSHLITQSGLSNDSTGWSRQDKCWPMYSSSLLRGGYEDQRILNSRPFGDRQLPISVYGPPQYGSCCKGQVNGTQARAGRERRHPYTGAGPDRFLEWRKPAVMGTDHIPRGSEDTGP